ncbi:MAG: hypothetical protein RLZZ436_877 [Planctomycetota bacterium]
MQISRHEFPPSFRGSLKHDSHCQTPRWNFSLLTSHFSLLTSHFSRPQPRPRPRPHPHPGITKTTKPRVVYTPYSCSRLANTSAEFPVFLCETLCTLWLKRNTLRTPFPPSRPRAPAAYLLSPCVSANFKAVHWAHALLISLRSSEPSAELLGTLSG